MTHLWRNNWSSFGLGHYKESKYGFVCVSVAWSIIVIIFQVRPTFPK